MTYSIVVPPKLVEDLYHIREATGIPIRQQIIHAIQAYLAEQDEIEAMSNNEVNENGKFQLL